MMLAKVVDNRVASRKIAEAPSMSEEAWLSQLVTLGIDVFVCGAVEEDFLEQVESYGIKIIRNVAGEVEEILSSLASGHLKDGYGSASQTDGSMPRAGGIPLSSIGKKTSEQTDGEMRIDCIECLDRPCLQGKSCTSSPENLFAVDKYSEFRHSMEVTMDISAETDRKLCRIAEFIYYSLGMEYKHIGVAFCVEMFQEAEILTRLLRRFFRVSPVCCKIGGHTQQDSITAVEGVLCNPVGQAFVLNSLRTDINVSMGLCVGCDYIFARHSEAPTTTLFVKDKSLANNPVNALYSKYYIDDILREA
jgi:uncharacterized metal-binding protein/predicted Fe-Mo cluster-binding NifX family protein